jgi:hypothetical protein
MGRPLRLPPPKSNKSSRKLKPNARSTKPPCKTLPVIWKGQGAGGATHAKVFVKPSALGHDDGHAGQGDDVVDDGGLTKQTF